MATFSESVRPRSDGSVCASLLLGVLSAETRLVAAIGFAVAISLAFFVLSRLTPRLNEWEELKKGNMAVALLWSAFTIALAIILYVVLNK